MRSLVRIFSWLLLLALLAGCDGGDPFEQDIDAKAAASGGFTLSVTSVSFKAYQYELLDPYQQFVSMQLTDDDATYVAYGFPGDVTPSWLQVDFLQQSAQEFTLVIAVKSTSIEPGTYSTTITVGTLDASGDVLQTQDIAVTYVLSGKVAIDGDVSIPNFVFGHPRNADSVSLPVIAHGHRWTVTSNREWLKVPSGTFTGDGMLTVSVDVAGWKPGARQGRVVVTNLDDPAQTSVRDVYILVQPPYLTMESSSIDLGGADGRDRRAVPLRFSLNTGSNAYPWTLAHSGRGSFPRWLSLGGTNGEVGGSGTSVEVGAIAGAVAGGSYFEGLVLTVNVNGVLVEERFQVSYRQESERLLASAEGIALAKLPSRATLSRTLETSTTFGRTDVAWQATSNRSWLTVTPSGVTPDGMTITANPEGLRKNQTYFATVQLRPADPAVRDGQNIRVGLWVGDQDPQPLTLPLAGATHFAVSPVEPLIFVHGADSTVVDAYNLYTGALERQIPKAPESPTTMTLSGDGRLLFVGSSKRKLRFFDATTGEMLLSWRFYSYYDTFTGNHNLSYVRPSGRPTLLSGDGTVMDVESLSKMPNAPWAPGTIAAAGSGDTVWVHETGATPSTLSRYRLSRPVYPHGTPLAGLDGTAYPTAEARDLAVSVDGRRIYPIDGSGEVPVIDSLTLQPLMTLEVGAPTNNGAVAWDGTFAAGVNSARVPDIALYDPEGQPKGTRECGGDPKLRLRANTLEFSGDGLRLACIAVDAASTRRAYVLDAP